MRRKRSWKGTAVFIGMGIVACTIKVFAIGVAVPDNPNKVQAFLFSGVEIRPTPHPLIQQNAELSNQIQTLQFQISQIKLNDLKRQNVISAINNHLKGTLKNKGAIYYSAGKENGVNPILMAAISIHETSAKINAVWTSGSSPVCVNYKNVAGINRRKGRPFKGRYCFYPSIEESINDFAVLLRENYISRGLDNIELIGNVFCPLDDKDNGKYGMDNSTWIPNVNRIYQKILSETGGLT